MIQLECYSSGHFQKSYKGYEFKWNPKSKFKISKTFLKSYCAEGKLINRENFREFVVV